MAAVAADTRPLASRAFRNAAGSTSGAIEISNEISNG